MSLKFGHLDYHPDLTLRRNVTIGEAPGGIKPNLSQEPAMVQALLAAPAGPGFEHGFTAMTAGDFRVSHAEPYAAPGAGNIDLSLKNIPDSVRLPAAIQQQVDQQAAAAGGAAANARAKANAAGPSDGYDFWHRPLNGVVVDAANSWGWNPDHARLLEQAAAGLIATGVGGGALYAALQGLQPAQQPLVIT
jgi:hypothetical protein